VALAHCLTLKIFFNKFSESDVKMMSLFLSGKSVQTLDNISQKMQAAAKNQEFELAAHLRDQMIGLRTIQEQHSSQSMGNMDVISVATQEGVHAVEVLFVRSGKQIGQECIFPKHTKGKDTTEVLSAFLPLYYLGKDTPTQLLLRSFGHASALLIQILDFWRLLAFFVRCCPAFAHSFLIKKATSF
jgi:excinuclease UvrABC nuclease subunit